MAAQPLRRRRLALYRDFRRDPASKRVKSRPCRPSDFCVPLRFAPIHMNEPRVPDGICSDDRARERVRRFARLGATGAFAIAIASALRPQANAQDAASAPPARSTAAVPVPGTDTASKFDVSVAASIRFVIASSPQIGWDYRASTSSSASRLGPSIMTARVSPSR